MFNFGEKIKFCSRDVIILYVSDGEVLIFVDEKTIKWVNQDLLEAS